MLVILSPSKSQEFIDQRTLPTQQPLFTKELNILVKKLQSLKASEIAKLMDISPKLAALNYERYQNFAPQNFTKKNSHAAILTYQGDVYQGLDAATLTNDELHFADQHLLILSGLYGAMRPFDLMQAYRLEMGIKLTTGKYKGLYTFWHEPLNTYINKRLKTEKILVNLASEEYSKAIDHKKFQGQMLKIEFKEHLKGQYRIVGIKAKRARGLMARFIIQNRLTDPKALQNFDTDGYKFIKKFSTSDQLVFHRG